MWMRKRACVSRMNELEDVEQQQPLINDACDVGLAAEEETVLKGKMEGRKR
jgi:hypothetical protein